MNDQVQIFVGKYSYFLQQKKLISIFILMFVSIRLTYKNIWNKFANFGYVSESFFSSSLNWK